MLRPSVFKLQIPTRYHHLLDYLHGFYRLAHLRYNLANLLCMYMPDFASGAFRAQAYRWAGFQIKKGAFIMGNLKLISGMPGFYTKLHIDEGVIIGNNVTINLDADVHLGKRVALGPSVLIYTGSHQIGPGSQRRMHTLIPKPVVIEDGCWIGLAAIILPGTTIGHGSIVAAGAVVMRDVPPDSYVEGNPASVVQQLPWGDR